MKGRGVAEAEGDRVGVARGSLDAQLPGLRDLAHTPRPDRKSGKRLSLVRQRLRRIPVEMVVVL